MTEWSELSEDGHEFTRVVHYLVALRHHQGDGAVTRVVDEALKLELRFCEECGQQPAYDGEGCIGCGHTKLQGPR